MKRGFTLIEIIVVIVIVGILAAVGMDQYSKTVEKSRGTEAKMILGDIRKLVYQYRLENGTITGITNADVNIGTSADQIPSVCRSTHYFYYSLSLPITDPVIEARAWRCASGGKSPNNPAAVGQCAAVYVWGNIALGTEKFYSCWGGY